MTSGKGLGKGLSALFGEEMTPEPAVRGIKLRDIEPNPDQPRREFDPEALAELEASIRENGVITPVTVRRTGDTYQLIAGERRWRAARAAGLEEIPAYVLDITEKEAYQLALIENLQRQDLNPIEEALGFQKLMEDMGLSQDAAAEKVGRSRPYIANSLRLLSLPDVVKDMVASGALSAGHGRALVPLDETKALQAAKQIIEGELSVRDTEKLAKRLMDKEEKSVRQKNDDSYAMYIAEIERRLSEQTNHNIRIKYGRRRGSVMIDYCGTADLDRICSVIEKLTK